MHKMRHYSCVKKTNGLVHIRFIVFLQNLQLVLIKIKLNTRITLV